MGQVGHAAVIETNGTMARLHQCLAGGGDATGYTAREWQTGIEDEVGHRSRRAAARLHGC